jgi:hypothetical protein
MPRASTSALLLVLLLAGCSGGSPKAAPTPSFSLPPLETPSPTPSPTPSVSPTASPTPRVTASASRHVPALDGDVDGDGKKDSVRASAELLTVELTGGGTVTAPVHAESPRSAPVLGYADVDRDGRSEVFVETAEGTSTQFVTPYRYDGKVLHELQLDAGPARLGIGGGVMHGDGFRCTGGKLQVLSSDSQDGTTYTVHTDTYTLGKTELLLSSSTTKKAKQGDALVEASYRPDCGSVGD